MEAVTRAAAGLEAVRTATEHLLDVLNGMDESSARTPSLCPGWSRAHVTTHLARNADGLINLLTWARTGVEHPMYPSQADRDADIEEGAQRPWRLVEEDLRAACERFEAAATRLAPDAWHTEVRTRSNRPLRAHEIPWARCREVWVHLVDLDRGVGFGDITGDHLEDLLDDAVRQFGGRADVQAMRLQVDLPDGRQRTWDVNTTTSSTGPPVRGAAATMLAWLTGRGDGEPLTGQLPRLPRWL